MTLARRLVNLGMAASCFLTCVVIVVFFSHNPFVRGTLGDVVVVVLIYFLLKSVRDFRPLRLTLFVFVVAFLVEIGQYVGAIRMLGMRENSVTKIVLGSAFDYGDLLAYAVGAALALTLYTKILP